MDYLIIGAGLSGLTLARLAADAGKKVLVVEKTNNIGGNCRDEIKDGMMYHVFGPHIMHFDSERVNDFVTRFTKLNDFENRVSAMIFEKLSPVPFNFKSIETYFGDDAPTIIGALRQKYADNQRVPILELLQSEDKLIQEVAQFAYKNVFENYTTKMWDLKPTEIDKSVTARVPVVCGYDDKYFSNKYEGLPTDGYFAMFDKMVDHKNITILKNTDGITMLEFAGNKVVVNYEGQKFENVKVIYCGQIENLLKEDKSLPYRSLDIQFETVDKDFYFDKDKCVINYPAHPTMTRICDYKVMTRHGVDGKTIISKEFPGAYNKNDAKFHTPYYPIINEQNMALYNELKAKAEKFENLSLLGRLAEYKYYDMDKAIERAMNLFTELEGNQN